MNGKRTVDNNEDGSIVWQPRRHIPQLDGLRGLAILLVTVYRFAKEVPDSALLSPLKAICGIGERGVDLFFVLSGFLITGVLIETIGRPGAYRTFIARRTLRIFPLYFAALGGLLAFSAYSSYYRGVFAQAELNQVYLWTYLTNVKMSWDAEWCFGALDHFWSLAVEEHFYLFWPLVVLFLPLQRLPRIAAALIAVCILSRIAFVVVGGNRVAPDVFSLFRFGGLLMGSGLAWACYQKLDLLKRFRAKTAMVVVLCALIAIPIQVLGRNLLSTTHTLWAVLWLGVLAVVVVSPKSGFASHLLESVPLRWLGKYSYAMYVFQSPLIPLAQPWFSAQKLSVALGEVPGSLVYIVSMMTLTFAVALASWHLFEKHFLDLKRFFPTGVDRERPA